MRKHGPSRRRQHDIAIEAKATSTNRLQGPNRLAAPAGRHRSPQARGPRVCRARPSLSQKGKHSALALLPSIKHARMWRLKKIKRKEAIYGEPTATPMRRMKAKRRGKGQRAEKCARATKHRARGGENTTRSRTRGMWGGPMERYSLTTNLPA